MDHSPNPVEKYTYYVQRLQLLNDPTPEPTEFVPTLLPSYAPTQSTLSPSPYELQNIIDANIKTSIITSVITTYFVLFFSYCCIVLRAKLKRGYLDSIYPSSHSSCSSRAVSTCTEEESTTKQEPFWFNDVYNVSEESTANIA